MDGGTGSELQRRGVNVLEGVSAGSGLQAWSALANIEAADVVQQVHQDYLRVGADVIISNNFWTSPSRLASVGLEDKWQDYARAAGENALKARDALNPEAYVAGGMAPPCLCVKEGNPEKSDVAIMGEDEFRSQFTAQARLLAELGVDLLLCEYVGHIADGVAAIDACSEAGLPVLLGLRHIQRDGSMQYGERLEDLAAALEGRDVGGILLMCCEPEAITAGLPRLGSAFDGPTGGYPDIGYHPTAPVSSKASPKSEERPGSDRDFLRIDDYYPARMAEFAQEWMDLGAQIIGGCCATGPEHILAMRPVLKNNKR
jgi:S-methylmethionine-dependent homocysteine/selenocysteine methylase